MGKGGPAQTRRGKPRVKAMNNASENYFFLHHLFFCSFNIIVISNGGSPKLAQKDSSTPSSLLINQEPRHSIREKQGGQKILLIKFRYLNWIIKCWQENSGSTGIYLLFLHIYFRYYMIFQNEPFGHGRRKDKCQAKPDWEEGTNWSGCIDECRN